MKAIEVARWFIYLAHEQGKEMSMLKLQKLLFYAQGFAQVWYDKFIIEEECEAWRYGPVYPAVYEKYKKYGSRPIPSFEGSLIKMIEDWEYNVIKTMWKDLGRYYNQYELAERSQREQVWKDAVQGDIRKHFGTTIPKEDIKKHFIKAYRRQ